ncbi:MAG: hypothetical protein Q8Q18_03315 [bacterium]|nr:hypothetical protein [bacterium]
MAKDWKRIVFFVFVLLGATLSFGYWALNQFDEVFDSLIASPSSVDPRSTVSKTSTSTSSIPSTD